MSSDNRTASLDIRESRALLRRQDGFSLVEIMVSLVLLSIGLLALAGLQTRGLIGGASSYQRSQATILSYDIIDRMRANRAAVYSAACAGLGGYDVTVSGALPASNAIATADLAQWKGIDPATAVPYDPLQPLQGLKVLPLGEGSVAVAVTAPAVCELNKVTATATVVVQWDDNRDGAIGADEQVTTTSRL